MLALSALGWVLADEHRAARFLALTGLAPEELRARAAEPALLGEVLDFIARHEPDLVACAAALAIAPRALVAAQAALAGPASHADWGA